jgi:hypothetical protein
MAFRPNYNQKRVERERAKRARREEKLREQQERTAARKATETDPVPPEGEEPG